MSKGGVDPITLTEGQKVQKGDIIGYSYNTSSLEYIHFEIREGGRYQRHSCNPWKYLPNDDNDYSTFAVTLDLIPNYNGIDCEAVVNVSVPPDQLTLTRIELHIIDNNDQPQEVRFYDMCGANSNHSGSEMDNWEYQHDPSDDYSYVIRISPGLFDRLSYSRHEQACYGFEFIHLPALSVSGKVMAKVFDVFDNSLSTEYETYSCSSGMPDPPAARYRNNPIYIFPRYAKIGPKTVNCAYSSLPLCSPLVTRNNRVWPIGGTTSVDLPQSSAYGSKQFFTKYNSHNSCLTVLQTPSVC